MGVISKLRVALARKRGQVDYQGLTVPVADPIVPGPVIKELLRARYERPEIDAVRRLLRDNDRVLELGTGLGIVSSLIVRSARGVTVQSFEANAGLLPSIRKLHALNGITGVTLNNALLVSAPKASTRTFYLHESFAESSMRPHQHERGRVEVPVRDIAEVFAELKPDIFLCDIEGGEADIFPGLDLTGVRAVVIELHPKVISAEAIRGIFETCVGAGLGPRDDLAAGTVVAFERR